MLYFLNMSKLLLGNIICIIASIIMVLIGLIKSNRKVLLAQCAQYSLFATGNFLLGGISGGISGIIGVTRNLFSLKFQIKWYTKVFFILLQAGLTLRFNNAGFLGWLPTIATFVFTWCIDTKSEILLKLLIIFAQTMWGIYDFSIKNYGTLAFDILTVSTNLFSILKILFTKKAVQQISE